MRGTYLARHVGALAVVGVLAAEQLPRVVVVDLHPQARRRVAVIVRADKAHVRPRRRDDAGDFVRAVFRRRARRALRHVVLGDGAADAEQAVDGVGVDVARRLVLLEVPAPVKQCR